MLVAGAVAVHGQSKASAVLVYNRFGILVAVQFNVDLLVDEMQSLLHAIQRRNLIGAAVIVHLAAVAEQTEYRVGRNVCGQDAQRTPQSQSGLARSVTPAVVPDISHGRVITHL